MTLWDEVRRLRDEGTTVFLTTQYLEEADQLADRVGIIATGKLVAEGTPAALKAEVGARTWTLVAARRGPGSRARARASSRASATPRRRRRAATCRRARRGAAASRRSCARLTRRASRSASSSSSSPTLDDVFLDKTGEPPRGRRGPRRGRDRADPVPREPCEASGRGAGAARAAQHPAPAAVPRAAGDLPDALPGRSTSAACSARPSCPASRRSTASSTSSSPRAITQSLLLGGVSAGIATALEIEGGFFDRLVASPIPRVGDRARPGPRRRRVIAVAQIAVVPRARAAVRRGDPGGVPGALLRRWRSGRWRDGLRRARRADRAARAQRLDGPGHLPARLRDPVRLERVLSARPAAAAGRLARRVQPAELHRRGHARPDHLLHLRGPVLRGLSPRPASRSSAIGAVDRRAARKAARRMSGDAARGRRAHAPRAQRDPARARRRAPRRARADDLHDRAGRGLRRGRASCRASRPGDFRTFIVPVGMLQGAGFTGAATGVNLARDIEQGWFDRLLVGPAPRPVLLAGIVGSAALRALLPATFLLVVALALGVDWPGARARPRRGAGHGPGDRDGVLGDDPRAALQHPAGGAAHADGLFIAVLFTTAYAPSELLSAGCARSPTSTPSRMSWKGVRQGFVGDVTWAVTWPALVAIAGLVLVFGALAVRGMRRQGCRRAARASANSSGGWPARRIFDLARLDARGRAAAGIRPHYERSRGLPLRALRAGRDAHGAQPDGARSRRLRRPRQLVHERSRVRPATCSSSRAATATTSSGSRSAIRACGSSASTCRLAGDPCARRRSPMPSPTRASGTSSRLRSATDRRIASTPSRACAMPPTSAGAREAARVLRPGGQPIVIDGWRTESSRPAGCRAARRRSRSSMRWRCRRAGPCRVEGRRWRARPVRIEERDLTAQVAPNLARLEAIAHVRARPARPLARAVVPDALLKYAVAAYLMPLIVQAGAYTYRLIPLERS